MNATSIAWTDFSANPLRYRDAAGRTVWGCVKTSPGCSACYAESIAQRFGRGGPFTKATMACLTPFLERPELHRLLTSRKISGKRVFLNDMTDTFGEWVPDEMIAALFGVMAARPDVCWQVLTKRAERMRRWFEWVEKRTEDGLSMFPDPPRWRRSQFLSVSARRAGADRMPQFGEGWEWPLLNVWLGVSVEDQATADERIPALLQTPAAVRFVSAEPLLGEIDIWAFLKSHWRDVSLAALGSPPLPGLDLVIAGGESGPGARPCDVAWIRSLVEQCRAAATACFVKQLGARPKGDYRGRKPPVFDNHPARRDEWMLRDHKGGDPNEWPKDLRVRDFPGGQP